MDTRKLNLNFDWKFHLGDEEPAWYKGYDDADWKKITLPHDWSVEYPFSKEYSSGTGYLKGGIGWYRGYFSFDKTKIDALTKVILAFDGVYKHAKVWINSYYLGKHAYGYTPFEFDITDMLSEDGKNEISVRIDHTDICDSRWFSGSGIYRDVNLYIENKVRVVRDGISFHTEKVKDNKAYVNVQYELINELNQPQSVSVKAILNGMSGRTEIGEGICFVNPGESKKLEIKGIIENPLIWSIESPYLYELETVVSVNNEVINSLPVVVGIRTFSFEPESGFWLNGENVKLKGVCVHHDAGCLGSAVTKEIWKRRLTVLKECGCNAIRCSHNPHMNALYELCDEMGFIVMDEAFDEWENAKNKWSTGHNVYPPRHQGYYEDFHDDHEKDLRTMVRRDRNHPSVVFYSIGNEIDYPNDPYCHPSFEEMTGNNDNNKPAKERQYDYNKPNMERLAILARHLVKIVKEEEADAVVTMALAFPELSLELGVGDALDVLGFNYKEHLYEQTRVKMPHKPLIGSENGHSYKNWLDVKDNKYVAGQFLWTGIDYLGEAHGWPIHGSSAGLITTAGYKKAEFYQTKSYWDEMPTPFLASVKKPQTATWLRFLPVWNYEDGDDLYVRCYAPNVEGSRVVFELNGDKVNDVTFNESEGAFFTEVKYKKGVLLARYFINGDEIATAELANDGTFDDFMLTPFEENDSIGYIHQIELSLLDKNGKVLRSSDSLVTVEVSGPGEFKGIDNGDLQCNVDMLAPTKSTFMGECIIYVKRIGTGEINVKVNCGNIIKDINV